MRSIWTGTIGFGLVSIPVRLYGTTDEHKVPLHQVHQKDGGRVRYKRVCEKDGEEVPYAEIAKGYEAGDGRTAVLTDDDLAELPLPSKKLIDVLAFVDVADIDPLALDKAYYVGAAEKAGAAKPYVLLREALSESGKAAVAKIALRSRESLALLRVRGEVLVLHTMHWPDEIRSDDGLAPSDSAKVRPQELKMAGSLMDTLSEGFDLDALHDDYASALDRLVVARLEGTEPASDAGGDEEQPDNVIDLVSALKASIAARDQGAEGSDSASGGGARKPAKKAAAKKAPAKKASGRSGTAKKSAPAKKTAKKSTRKAS
ncbi:Ku protein [Streptomyces sp. NPDC060194]|uniref:non-homologous end joining protein Ku n=1 Tax=Streptomyces sp. NPDC060194 TaxID=3347069 RepID=UPI003660EFC8